MLREVEIDVISLNYSIIQYIPIYCIYVFIISYGDN